MLCQCQSVPALTIDCTVAVNYAINAGSVSSGTCYLDPLRMILILSQWVFSDNQGRNFGLHLSKYSGFCFPKKDLLA